MRKLDISGQKFGRLTALYRLHNTKGRTKWLCVCECGNLTEVATNNLTNRHTKSCDCLRKEKAHKHDKTKHGKSNTRLYYIWHNMKNRCCNKNTYNYKYYGERGIVVCDEWLNDFQTFYNWAYENDYNDKLTIDRINVNGNYEPSNCKWSTAKQQARNRRDNKNYTINGETHCLKEWCEILGLNYNTVQTRICTRGWPIERALELQSTLE